MDSGVIEFRFNCDEASKKANELFDKVMNRDWLLEHGIAPFDTDGAWEEVSKQLSHIGERHVLNVTRIVGHPNSRWDEQRQIWAKVFGVLAKEAQNESGTLC